MASWILTTGDDIVTFNGESDDQVYATAATLNPGDQLDGGAHYDTLFLQGSGTFDLSALAKFTNFEEVHLSNGGNTATTVTLRDSANLTVSVDAMPNGSRLNLGGGTTALTMTTIPNAIHLDVYGGSGTSTITDTSTLQGAFDYHLGSGTATVTTAGYQRFFLADGTATLNLTKGGEVTASTGNATINVTGGNGGTFNLSSGATDITFHTGSDYYKYFDIAVGSGRTSVDATDSHEVMRVVLTDIHNLNASDNFIGNDDKVGSGYESTLTLNGTGAFNLGSVGIGGRWSLQTSANQTLAITTAIASHLQIVRGDYSTDTLTTADGSLDLTNTAVVGTKIASTNATGTQFTVGINLTGLNVVGGPGDDTVYAPGFAFTANERSTIFAQGSVETITDQSGTYHAPPASAMLTTGNDTFTGGTGDDTVTAPSASTLNPGDQLDGGTGYDTLQLFGGGTFDLSALTKFANMEEVDLSNTTATAATVTLRDGVDLMVRASATASTGNTINMGSGARTLILQTPANKYGTYIVNGGSSGTSLIQDVGPSSSSNDFHLGNGTTTVSTSAYDRFFLTGGITHLTLANGGEVHGGTGVLTINSSGPADFTLSTGSSNITIFGPGSIVVGSGQTTIDASTSIQPLTVTLSDVHALGISDMFNGNATLAREQTLQLLGSGAFNLGSVSIGGHWGLWLAPNLAVGVTNALAQHLVIVRGDYSTDSLTTGDAALDLSNTAVVGTKIASTNVAGTQFTVASSLTGLNVIGGPGNDVVYAPSFAFTPGERSTIFGQGSVERIIDQSGTYDRGSYLTTGNDTITGGAEDSLITASSASTLNPGDQLDGGLGYDTLALFGGGTFDLGALAKFVNFEEVDLSNNSSTAATLTLRNGVNLAVKVTSTASATGNTINLGSGATTLTLQAPPNQGGTFDVYGGSGTATILDQTTGGGFSTFHLGSGTTTVTAMETDSFFLSSGTTTINMTAGGHVTAGSGNTTINLTGGIGGAFDLSTGATDITVNTGSDTFGIFDFTVGSGRTSLDATNSHEVMRVILGDIHNLNSSDVLIGNDDKLSGGRESTLTLVGTGAFDLGSITVGGRWSLSLTPNETIGITSAIASHLQIVRGDYSTDALTTAAASLDLSTTAVVGTKIISTNPSGTTFKVGINLTGLNVVGGAGNDTVYAPTFAFTANERATIFSHSVEIITDQSGTYHNPNSPLYEFSAPVLATSQYGAGAAGGGWTSQDLYPRVAADVNGDGRADIVAFGEYGVSVSLGQTNGSFGAPQSDIRAFGHDPSAGGLTSNDTYPRFLADVNGDGKADIVGFGDTGTLVSLATGGGHFGNPFLGVAQFGVNNSVGGWSNETLYTRVLGDVNGDGMADIVGFGAYGTYVSLATGGGHFSGLNFELNQFGSDPSGGNYSSNDIYPRTVADVNGDGMDDIIGFGEDGVHVALATGGGHFAAPVLALQQFGHGASAGGWSSQTLYPRVVGDVNGDGRADIVGFGEYGLYYALGQANGTFGPITIDRQIFGHDPSHGGLANNDLYPRQLADVNGDGHADIIATGDNGLYISTGDFLYT